MTSLLLYTSSYDQFEILNAHAAHLYLYTSFNLFDVDVELETLNSNPKRANRLIFACHMPEKHTLCSRLILWRG